MPLLLAGQTEGWKFHLQLTDGSFIRAVGLNNLVFAGPTAGQPMNAVNDSTHLFAGATHLCATAHGQNTRRLTNLTVNTNGTGAAPLPIAIGNCALLVSFFSLAEVQTSNARIYSYDGTTDSTPMNGVTVYMVEGGVSTSWVASNGSNNPLFLQDNPIADIEHNFWVAVSVENAGGSGQVAGALKISLSYI